MRHVLTHLLASVAGGITGAAMVLYALQPVCASAALDVVMALGVRG